MSGTVLVASVYRQSRHCTLHIPGAMQVIQPGRPEWCFSGSVAGLTFGLYTKRPGNLPRKNGFFHPLRKILENSFTSLESEDYVWQPMRLEFNCGIKRLRKQSNSCIEKKNKKQKD